MTSTLDTDQPLTGFITDDLEGHQLAGRVAPEAGLQLPYLDLDDPGFTWPTHPLVGLPPLAPLVPSDRLGADNPGAPLQLKRDRNALRVQADENVLHPAPAPTETVFPTRRSLRQSRAAEPDVVRTFTQSLPVIAAAPVPDGPVTTETPAADADSLALAEELEAALRAALADSPETEKPSARSLRLTHALALANDEPVDTLRPAPSVADGEYLSMIKSYGPFPVLLPTHRDFRPVLALSVFGGLLGLDRFYEGKHVSGFLKLATAGGLGIWWVADIIAILNGKAADKDGHHFTGEKKHRVIAWLLTAALFAGLTTVAVSAVTPAVTAAAGTVHEALFPTPAPVPTWTTLAVVEGTPDPVVLQVTGDRLRFTYNFPGPVYAYLQKEGDTEIPAESLLLHNRPTQGSKEVAVAAGTYRLVIRTDGTAWTTEVEELALHG